MVANMTSLPHIKELCLIKMISMACMKILNKQIVELIFGYDQFLLDKQNPELN